MADKNVLKTEDIIAWAETIPLEELWSEIRKITGISELKFKHNICDSTSGVKIEFKTQNISDKIGCLGLIFKPVYIVSYDSNAYCYDNYYDDNGTHRFKFAFWVRVAFELGSYARPQCFLMAEYTDAKGWSFETGVNVQPLLLE